MKNKLFFSIAILFILQAVGLISITKASSGDIDTSFGVGGLVHFSTPAAASVVQSDNKVVVAEYNLNAGTIIVKRFYPEGDPDLGFGLFSQITIHQPIIPTDLAVQSDGKIVLVGYGTLDFFITRINKDGTLDTTFGNNGIVTTDFAGGEDRANDVAIRADGKIVVVGSATIGADERFAIARYDEDGSPDTTFSGNGRNATGWGDGINWATTVKVLTGGKSLLGGNASLNGHYNFAIARFNNDGTLDTGFGSGGKVITDHHTETVSNEMLVLPDGKIVAGGAIYNHASCPSAFDILVSRYSPTGSLDTTFGTGGSSSFHLADGVNCGTISNGAFIQPDGKIVVTGGAFDPSGNFSMMLARIGTTGAINTGFGDNGFVVMDQAIYGTNWGFMVSRQSDGKIIAAGAGFMVRLLP